MSCIYVCIAEIVCEQRQQWHVFLRATVATSFSAMRVLSSSIAIFFKILKTDSSTQMNAYTADRKSGS